MSYTADHFFSTLAGNYSGRVPRHTDVRSVKTSHIQHHKRLHSRVRIG